MTSTEAFTNFGRSVINCAPILSEMFNHQSDALNEFHPVSEPPSWRNLRSHSFIYGNTEMGYWPSTILDQLAIQLSSNGAVARAPIDFQIALEQLEGEINSFLVAKKESFGPNGERNAHKAQQFYRNILGLVRTMLNDMFVEASQIELAVNSEFGYVESLALKRIQNEKLLNRVKTYTEKLSLLTYRRLMDLSQDDPKLGVLFRDLAASAEENTRKLKSSSEKLNELFYRTRQMHENTQLVRHISMYLDEVSEPYSEPVDDGKILDDLNNGGINLEMQAALDLENIDHPDVANILKSLPKPRVEELIEDVRREAAEFTEIQELPAQELDIPQIDQFIMEFIKGLAVGRQSAAKFWRQVNMQIPLNVWMFCLHEALKPLEGVSFDLEEERTAGSGEVLVRNVWVERDR